MEGTHGFPTAVGILLGVWALFLLVGWAAVASGAQDERLTPAQVAAAERLASDAEPTVIDAAWRMPDELVVARLDDGTRQNGFAEYACRTVRELGVERDYFQVRIIDAKAFGQGGHLVELGRAQCLAAKEAPTVVRFD